ncbi:hypothetical protein M433DRAFT_102731 [Acidomyces richmondensis BFW]|nr:MAG: hypothetical protein FE78DRAFT_532554 [Acidomyces sp. 'richmondensis']KYG48434.1 hypothetical protein M433DRAFT_102731 [Acidomyces richmondensis BFW]
MSRPKVLVTGCNGHLGQALMLTLHSAGYFPVGVDIRHSPDLSGLETTIGSITDQIFISQLFQKYEFEAVLHTAALHKPHICTHTKSQFVDININGTLILLEEAAKKGCKAFIFSSSTTTFGRALSLAAGKRDIDRPGVPLINESVVPLPKNIYGVTKVAAEDLCELMHKEHALPTIILRFARFFPEADDDEERRCAFEDANLKMNELTYRRVDLADAASANICALNKAIQGKLTWGKYVISAPSPFLQPVSDENKVNIEPRAQVLERLHVDARTSLREVLPEYETLYRRLGWNYFDHIDRVYDCSKAMRELDWCPEFTFAEALRRLSKGEEWRSPLALKVGRRGYHRVATGVYTLSVDI